MACTLEYTQKIKDLGGLEAISTKQTVRMGARAHAHTRAHAHHSQVWSAGLCLNSQAPLSIIRATLGELKSRLKFEVTRSELH